MSAAPWRGAIRAFSETLGAEMPGVWRLSVRRSPDMVRLVVEVEMAGRLLGFGEAAPRPLPYRYPPAMFRAMALRACEQIRTELGMVPRALVSRP